MTTRRVLVAVSMLLLATLVYAPSASADSQARIVRLSLVDGPVQIDRGQGFEKAIMNMPITQGMKLSTDEGSRAEVEFEDGTSLRLAPGTDVAFPTLVLLASGGRATTVLLSQGTAYFNVRHKRDDDFRVAFADREIQADRNVHFRLDLAGGHPELAVFNGDLEFRGPQGNIKIKKNETLALDISDAGRYDLAKNIVPENYDTWDNERLNYVAQYASASYNTHSPYYYGASDLNYYGSWYSYPGYGMLWRPFGVGYAWDPFYNGAWAWYPSFGYTWVSTYPWGWTPYRYGSWSFIPNFGWAWRPGTWRTWYTVPPVYNAPAFYHGPKPPPPVTVVGAGGFGHHPTVLVDNGVIRDRDPRRYGDSFVGGRRGDRPVTTPATVPVGSAPAAAAVQSFTPAPGTGIVAPGGKPVPAPHSDMRTHSFDRGDRGARAMPMPVPRADHSFAAPQRSGPAPQMQHSAPMPHVQHSAPAPRMSAPAAPHAAPSSSGGVKTSK
jgi:FecR protein